MDPNTIRLILIVVGALMILLLYLWERHREKEADAEEEGYEEDFDAEEDVDSPYGVHKGKQEPTLGALDEDRATVHARSVSRSENQWDGDDVKSEDAPRPESRPVASGSKLEPLLIQVSVSARGQPFPGPALMDMAESCGLHPGEMDIFHCLDEFDDETRVYFSMANMVKPGTFPFDDMEDFSTPGLMLFAQLEGNPEDMTILDEMIATARKLAISLNGDVLDDTRRSLTVKKQDEMRKAVLNHQLHWSRTGRR
ncbi:cell division protein ZipA C-terminal FtsZ-binding domain-containing protein [Thiocystis violascens]|uniref:Cell division protein ZipA n=1 Tax=Thiocystis violascens (strain ATCC 17096 / DSM 198 / 6111) TaxID=765911 RepID=I3YH17_THIV6|nr:cell division protein ZipA C-terminal FtsZ-binding domain-containing protein [Thiocystis violascens]AFL76285.1 cell division protein [Thiocystis violascens DSM 198]